MKMRIAVVQQNGNPGQPEENREKAIGFALQALDLNADVILFHEEMLVGYTKMIYISWQRPWMGQLQKHFSTFCVEKAR